MICQHQFDHMLCCAPLGHAGPHVTSNEQYPYGRPIVMPVLDVQIFPANVNATAALPVLPMVYCPRCHTYRPVSWAGCPCPEGDVLTGRTP